jgi:hypothetical protein
LEERLEAHGPNGIPRTRLLPGAIYRFRKSIFESFLQYERDVLKNLRLLQLERCHRGDSAELLELEETVRRELSIARESVDTELDEGRGRADVVRAVRVAPEVPASVLEYSGPAEYLAEDSRRGSSDESGLVQLGGADFAFRWGLEHPFKRWRVSRWRISWLCDPQTLFFEADDADHSGKGASTTEVYAVEFGDGGRAEGRVWLLGKLRTYAAAKKALNDLVIHVMDERNSLVVAAEAVAAVEREGQGPPD